MSTDALKRTINDWFGRQGILQMKQRCEKLVDRWKRIHDADWGGETNLAHWYRECYVREQMGSCISASLEALHCAIVLIELAQSATAQYTVMRTAIETSSTGLWLSHAGRKDKMIFYSLKLAYRDNKNIMDIAALIGEDSNRELLKNRKGLKTGLEKRVNDLNAYSNRKIENFPNYTQIVKLSDAIVKNRKTFTAEIAWKICSGMAHGSRDVILGLTETTSTGNRNENTEEVTIRQNILLSAGIMNPAMENCEELIRMYESACVCMENNTAED